MSAGCTIESMRHRADAQKAIGRSVVFYLASPYSHPNRFVRQYRFEFVAHAAAALYNLGIIVFCPISHSHPIQLINKGMMSWETWATIDLHMLKSCEQIIILTMQGWGDSIGVTAERQAAINQGFPIFYLDPETLGMHDDTAEILPHSFQWKPQVSAA